MKVRQNKKRISKSQHNHTVSSKLWKDYHFDTSGSPPDNVEVTGATKGVDYVPSDASTPQTIRLLEPNILYIPPAELQSNEKLLVGLKDPSKYPEAVLTREAPDVGRGLIKSESYVEPDAELVDSLNRKNVEKLGLTEGVLKTIFAPNARIKRGGLFGWIRYFFGKFIKRSA